MEDILNSLTAALDGRVYVAVGRGLWDFVAKEIYDYVDSLQEGKENKVGSTTCCKTAQKHVAPAVCRLECTCMCLRPSGQYL